MSGAFVMKRSHTLPFERFGLVLLCFALCACGGGPDTRQGGGRFDPVRQETPTDPDKPPEIRREAKGYFMEAVRAAQAGQRERAVDLLKEAIEEDERFAEAYFNIGVLLEAEGDEQGAIEWYEKSATYGTKFGEGIVRIGLIHQRAGRHGEAEGTFERAHQVQPFDGRAHRNIALIRLRRDDSEGAIKEVRNALKENSANPDAYDVLCQIYYKMKRYRLAELVCQAGLENFDRNHPGLNNSFGLVRLKLQEVNKAIILFKAALKADPDHVAALMNLGAITFGYRDYEQSYALFRRALERAPKNQEARLSKAVAARALGRIDEAQQLYQEILSVNPRDERVFFNQGVIAYQSQNYDEAIRLYGEALNYATDDAVRARFSKALDNVRQEKEALAEAAAAEAEARAEEAAEAAEAAAEAAAEGGAEGGAPAAQ